MLFEHGIFTFNFHSLVLFQSLESGQEKLLRLCVGSDIMILHGALALGD